MTGCRAGERLSLGVPRAALPGDRWPLGLGPSGRGCHGDSRRLCPLGLARVVAGSDPRLPANVNFESSSGDDCSVMGC